MFNSAPILSDDQVNQLVADLYECYGYDFTSYSKASLKRRINRLFTLDKFPSYAELRHRLKNDERYFERFLVELTVNVTEMFRDPDFFHAIVTEVLPVLATYPFIRIWHAGCSTGEELYSLAILLKEANLLHKSLLYATDINPAVVKSASHGIMSSMNLPQYAENYRKAGGKQELSQYYVANYDHIMFNSELQKKMVFSTHNLVSDRSFNQFQLILCRNVLIYFEKDLQDKVLALFDESLDNLGYLGLGNKETLKLSSLGAKFQQLGKNKIWRKKP